MHIHSSAYCAAMSAEAVLVSVSDIARLPSRILYEESSPNNSWQSAGLSSDTKSASAIMCCHGLIIALLPALNKAATLMLLPLSAWLIMILKSGVESWSVLSFSKVVS